MQEPLLPALQSDQGAAVPVPSSLGAGRGRRAGGMAKPRSIGESMYTLARSMRIFPTALSPHR
jgi:hypothetical protein